MYWTRVMYNFTILLEKYFKSIKGRRRISEKRGTEEN